jgi:hypothetical protein
MGKGPAIGGFTRITGMPRLKLMDGSVKGGIQQVNQIRWSRCSRLSKKDQELSDLGD